MLGRYVLICFVSTIMHWQRSATKYIPFQEYYTILCKMAIYIFLLQKYM